MNPVIQFKATTLLPPIARLLACFAAVFISVTNPASADDLPAPGEPPLAAITTTQSWPVIKAR